MLSASSSLPLLYANAHTPKGDRDINTVAVSRHNSNARVEVMTNHQRRLATACTAILRILLKHWHQMTCRAGQLAIHAVIVSLGSGTATSTSVNNHCRSNTHLWNTSHGRSSATTITRHGAKPRGCVLRSKSVRQNREESVRRETNSHSRGGERARGD